MKKVLAAVATLGVVAGSSMLLATHLIAAATLSWSSGFNISWLNTPTATMPWNSMTVLIDFAIAPNPDGTINMQPTWWSAGQMAGDVQAAHAHGKLALISIGGAGFTTWDGACNSANRAKFASNLVGVVSQFGYDGVDLDVEQDWGYPTYTDYTACVAGIRAVLPANDLLTTDGDPDWQAFMVSHIAQYVSKIQLMSYWTNATQVVSQVANYTSNGMPLSQLVIGMGTDSSDPTYADLTPTDINAKVQYVLNNGLAGVMNWFVTTGNPGTDAIAAYLSGTPSSPPPTPSPSSSPSPSPSPSASPTPSPIAINNVPCTITLNGVRYRGHCTGTFAP